MLDRKYGEKQTAVTFQFQVKSENRNRQKLALLYLKKTKKKTLPCGHTTTRAHALSVNMIAAHFERREILCGKSVLCSQAHCG